MESIQTEALRLAQAGYPVFPCNEHKAPIVEGGFKAATTDLEKVRKLFASEGVRNIGLATGEVSGLTVIDLDIDKDTGAKAGAINFFGLDGAKEIWRNALLVRTPSGGHHVYVRYAPGSKSNSNRVAPKVDIRSDGGYIIAPYPGSGYEYKRSGSHLTDWDLPKIDPDWLRAAPAPGTPTQPVTVVDHERDRVLECLATAPNELGRDDWIAVLHALKRHFGDDPQIKEAWIDWSLKWPGSEPAHRLGYKWESCKPNGAVGLGTFLHHMGEHAPLPAVVPADDLEGWYYLEGEHVVMNVNDNRVCLVPAFNLGHPHDMQATERLVQNGRIAYRQAYRPDLYRGNGDPIAIDEAGVRWINTYKPINLIPNLSHLETEEWQRVQHHFFNVLANEDEANHVLDWCAYLVQHPGKKVNWAPVIWGPQGNGKSTIFQILEAALGNANVTTINKDALQDRYNSFAVEHCLVGIEEVKIGFRKYDVLDKLKELITSPTISVRRMRQELQSSVNIANYIFFSNHPEALALTKGDRRYMVCKSKHAHKDEFLADGMNDAYFDALYEVILSQPEIIYSGLKLRDITAFKPYAKAPHTEALDEMAEAALPEDAATLKEIIADLVDDGDINPGVIPVTLVQDRFCREHDRKLRTKALKNAFGHLDLHLWQGNGEGRIKLRSGLKTRLYVSREHLRASVEEIKELLIDKPSYF